MLSELSPHISLFCPQALKHRLALASAGEVGGARLTTHLGGSKTHHDDDGRCRGTEGLAAARICVHVARVTGTSLSQGRVTAATIPTTSAAKLLVAGLVVAPSIVEEEVVAVEEEDANGATSAATRTGDSIFMTFLMNVQL